MQKNSLSQNIDKYLEKEFVQFHSPAHAGKLNPRDLTELDGLDDLQNPQEVLKYSQEQVAQIFGAAHSYFLVGGASLGMQAACMALKIYLEKNKITQPVLVARNVHKSVVAGIIISGLNVEWFEPKWCHDLGVFKNTEFDLDTKYQIERSYSALILTNPTYEGFYTEIPKFNIPVIVDEAHGAHYHFSDQLPKPALDYGADIVVQSWHKTLGSLTQTGVIHSNRLSKIPSIYIENSVKLLQTTSPSYLLLESICKIANYFERKGKEIIANTIGLAAMIPRDYLFENHDPTRLIILGEKLEDKLYELNINVEHANDNFALAVINPGNSIKDLHSLKEALNEISPQKNYANIAKPGFALDGHDLRKAFFNSNGELDAPCPPGIVMKGVGLNT
jgi:arginine decarboxylase